MTPDMLKAFLHAIITFNDTVQLCIATVIPLMYIWIFVLHRNAIVRHLRSGAWLAGRRNRVPLSAEKTVQIRRGRGLRTGEPTLLMRGIGGVTSIYTIGARPLVSHLRIGKLRLTCERQPDPGLDRPDPKATRQVRSTRSARRKHVRKVVGKHRVD